MAITVEELEIRIEVQQKKALADLEILRKKLEATFAQAMPSIQKTMSQVRQQLTAVAPAMQAATGQVKAAAGKTAAQMGKIAERQKKAFVKSSEAISKQLTKDSEYSAKIARQMNAELSKIDNAKLQQQQDVNQAIERMLEREAAMRQKVSRAAQPRTEALQGPRIATRILNEQPHQTAKMPNAEEQVKSTSYFQQMAERIQQQLNFIKQQMATLAEPMMQSLNKGLAQYYAKLDVIKAALHKVGLYGKEVAEPIKKSAEKATPTVKKLGNELQATAKRGGTAFEQLGITIARSLKFVVIYKGLRAMFDFIKQGIQNAINAPEIENMFRVAFGAGADEAAKFAEAMRTAYGIDPYVSKQMLGTFQNMATAMGAGIQNASEMSKGLTLLANDISSLYNVDPQQAAENLQSALAGQGRAVRKYGYIILDSTIKETAYRLGIAQTGAELTEQQKVLARYMTLQEQSKNAQGDLARTIGNVANQLRILGQNIVAAGRSIGTAFIPFIQAAMPPLNAFFTLLQRMGNALSAFTFGLFGIDFSEWKKQQEAIIGGTGDMSQAEDEYADSVDKAAKAQKGLLSGFDVLNISKRKDGAPSVGDGGFIIPEIEAPTGQSPFEKMADTLQASLEKIKKTFEPFITNVGNSFKWLLDNVLTPLKNYTVSDLLPTFFEALAAVLNSPVWADVGTQIAKIYNEFLQPIASWAGEKVVELFGWIKNNGDAVATTIIAVGTAFLTWKAILVLDKAAGIIIAIGTALKGLSFARIGTFLTGILPNLGIMFGWISTVALPAIAGAFSAIGAAVGGALTAVAAFFGISVGWLVAIVAAVVAAVIAVILNWDKIVVFFTKTLPTWWKTTVMPFFKDMWKSFTEGLSIAIEWATGKWNSFYTFITDVLKKIMDTVTQLGINLIIWATVEVPKFVNTVINLFKELPSKIWDIGADMIKSLWEGVQSMIGWLGDKMSGFIDGIMEGFKDGFGGKSINLNVNQKTKGTASGYNVPRLANGGVLTTPRLVMAGEYAGARTNPEIVTPQSLMYETSLKAQQAANQPVVALLKQLIDITKDGKVIELDGYELGRQMDRISGSNNLRLGGI